ncbi:MAG: hypothetical protein SGJ18_08750 [Pseudomonadota bacterium]|nr:hypothetical protein [Pseudomonadota bacterium]
MIKFFTGLFLLISTPAWSGGDVVNNGAGLAETRFIIVYTNLEAHIELCVLSKTCRLTAIESELLKKIYHSIETERKTKDQLQFRSQKDEDFEIDGQMKVAKTGSHIGDIIYINLNMIYEKNAEGAEQPLSDSETLAILVHEMGHHHGVKDEILLDSLAAKVQASSQGRSQRVELGYLAANVALSALNFGNWERHSQLWASDGKQLIDLNSFVKAAIQCRPGTSLRGSNISNLHWKLEPLHKDRRVMTFQSRAWLVGFCRGPRGWDRPFVRNVFLTDLTFKITPAGLEYIPGSAGPGKF